MLLKTSSNPSLSFDSEFAESVSKPLPEWFLEQEKLRKKFQEEEESKRRKAVEEFKEKYSISKKNESSNQKVSRSSAGFGINWSFFNNKKEHSQKSNYQEDSELSTKEKWDKFLQEENETTGFYIPGLLEVFPELYLLKWPIWAKKKDGKAIKCLRDEDCQFPQTCCAHPIIPGDRFCCTGWGQRAMVPSYAKQFIKPSVPEQKNL